MRMGEGFKSPERSAKELSNIVFEEVGGGFFSCVKRRASKQGLNKLHTAQFVADTFNKIDKVSIIVNDKGEKSVIANFVLTNSSGSITVIS